VRGMQAPVSGQILTAQSRYDLEIEKDRLGDALDGIRPLTAAG
jgi:hypothetical protein